MQIAWSISETDLQAMRDIIGRARSSRFTTSRLRDNVSGPPPRFSREEFWRVMLGCLLTTQQRSGPESSVSRFLRRRPFQPAMEDCSPETTESFVRDTVVRFGGIRRAPTIAKYAAANLTRLQAGDWLRIEEEFQNLLVQRRREPRSEDADRERKAAVLMCGFRGFGPKQSRNLWQWLGLTRFEIPIDSRVIRWLNENHLFPFALSAQGLIDEGYYRFVMSGIQNVRDVAGSLPCVFDAAVFASYDRDWELDELDY